MTQCELCMNHKPKNRNRYKCIHFKTIMKAGNDYHSDKTPCAGYRVIENVNFVSTINNLFVMFSTFGNFIYELQKIFGQYTGVVTDGMVKPKKVEIHWKGQAALRVVFLPSWRWMAMKLIEPEYVDDELLAKLMAAKKVIGQKVSEREDMSRGDGPSE